jgi:hypothetical protein
MLAPTRNVGAYTNCKKLTSGDIVSIFQLFFENSFRKRVAAQFVFTLSYVGKGDGCHNGQSNHNPSVHGWPVFVTGVNAKKKIRSIKIYIARMFTTLNVV